MKCNTVFLCLWFEKGRDDDRCKTSCDCNSVIPTSFPRFEASAIILNSSFGFVRICGSRTLSNGRMWSSLLSLEHITLDFPHQKKEHWSQMRKLSSWFFFMELKAQEKLAVNGLNLELALHWFFRLFFFASAFPS